MTRKEILLTQAHKERSVSEELAFQRGVEWADNNPNWISIEDKLPPFDWKDDGTWRCSFPVLVYCRRDDMIYIGRYEVDDLYGKSYWLYNNNEKHASREIEDGYVIDYITHWMPLPQPPKGE